MIENPLRVIAGAAIALMAIGASTGAQSSPSAAKDTTIREYRGAYQRGFEQSWFIPCDLPKGETRWWVTLTDEALAQRDSILKALTAAPTNGLEVRWRGTVGPRMMAGMMGGGSRYMLVTEIIEIRPMPRSGKCAEFKST